MTKTLVKAAFYRSLPVLGGYLVLGVGFGILLGSVGYGPLWALAMSLAVYTGSMQYVGVSLIAGGASVLTVALTTLMVNARHLFYSISMYDLYKNAGKCRNVLICTLTDETYSLLCGGSVPENTDPDRYRLAVSLLNYGYWAAGSLLGGLLEQVLPFDTTGIEFSMTALFVTVFVDQWRGTGSTVRRCWGWGRRWPVCCFSAGSCFSFRPWPSSLWRWPFCGLPWRERRGRRVDNGHTAALILTMAAVTAALRFLPFFLLGGRRRTPAFVSYLGRVLPYAIMGMLVVYCLKDAAASAPAVWLPALAGVAVTVGLHLWKGSTLASILGGTVCYMVLVQLVF